jgi:diguanylate cyclase
LASRIRKAIANDEFVAYFQPKVRSDDQTIMGAEALARWHDPELGLVMPNDFIPIAEDTGLIEAIGTRILEISCSQAHKWYQNNLGPIAVSVNVSPRQFRNPNLVRVVEDILMQTGLPPSWLELEITESMIMGDMTAAVAKMVALRDLGIGLSIDDFGTGYSSLSYLGSFPLTALKIDRAFITDVTTNPKTAEIARAIIGLSKGLQLEVIAEGCEISDHLKFLKDHGCDAIQGFYFSKAVPAHTFEAMLRAGIVYPVPDVVI